MRTPTTGVRMERASVQFASLCCSGRSIRPHHCAPFQKRCVVMRSNQPTVVTAVRKPHARAFHARAEN
eukprot:4304574-Lingulodinium_polyedra.AAC.1